MIYFLLVQAGVLVLERPALLLVQGW